MGIYGGGIEIDIKLSKLSPYFGAIFMGSYTNSDTILIFDSGWTDPMDYSPICDRSKIIKLDVADYLIIGISWESLLIALHDVGTGISTLLDMWILGDKDLYYIFFPEDQT